MKKRIIIFTMLAICILFIDNVSAMKYDAIQPEKEITSDGILEDFEISYDKYDNVDSITASYTIPEDYNKDEINIVPLIFDKLGELGYVMPGDKIKINIKIINNSKFDYKYKDNSFILSTENLEEYEKLGYLKKTDAVGFNGKPIYTVFSPYRTTNTAIYSLFDNPKQKISASNMTDLVLSDKLKEKGYENGIKDLNKYYLDFYNKKYNLDKTMLEEFNDDIIREIFSGNMVEIKETNTEIIKLSYDWFYNKLLSYTFEDQVYSDKTSEQYSIGSYMRKETSGNDYFKQSVDTISSNSNVQINNMSLNINGPYTVNLFMNYMFSGYMKFTLNKIQSESVDKGDETEEKPDDDIKKEDQINNDEKLNNKVEEISVVEPPKTGIDLSKSIILIPFIILLLISIRKKQNGKI